MREKLRYLIPLSLMLALLSGCVSTGPVKMAIPVYSMQEFAQSGQYFKYVSYVSDRGLSPFASEKGVTQDAAAKAQAAGGTAMIVKKVYERYTRGGISGTYLYVDGIAIIPRKATKQILFEDLNTLKTKPLPIFQVAHLMNFIKKQNMHEAVPVLREVLMKGKYYKKSFGDISGTYIAMATGKEVNALVPLAKDKYGHLQNVALQVLAKHGTKKQAPLFLTLVKSGGAQNSIDYYAAIGLKRVGGKHYTSEWKKILQHHSNDSVREIAAEVLVKSGQRRVVQDVAMRTNNTGFKKKLNALLLN